MNDLSNIKDCSDFIIYEEKNGTGYPITLYVYALLNYDEILKKSYYEDEIINSTIYSRKK